MITATISPEGQVIIPEEVRKRLKLTAGTEVTIDVQGDGVLLKPVVSKFPDWRTMQGMAAGGESLTKALMEDRAADIARDNALIEERAAELARDNVQIDKGR